MPVVNKKIKVRLIHLHQQLSDKSPLKDDSYIVQTKISCGNKIEDNLRSLSEY